MDTGQPSNDKFLEWLIELMKDGSPVERRVPKNLKGRFNRALFRYGQLGLSKDESMELRGRDASNWGKCIAVWGVLNNGAPVPGLDLRPFPHGYHEAAKELREVCNELSHYLNGGAEDYCAAPIVEIVGKRSQVKIATLPRKKEDKEKALSLWEKWQSAPSDFKNKAAFILAVRTVGAVNPKQPVCENTALAWFKEFRNKKTSEAWETQHGKNYPQ